MYVGSARGLVLMGMSSLDLPVRTSRLSLRAHQKTDAPSLHRIYAQPDVARYLLDDPWTPETAQQKIGERIPKTDLDGETGALALVIERDQIPIGDVHLWFTDRERRVAEIGWLLDPEHGGRGFATEAVSAVLDLAFDHYRVHRVAAQMDARNTASARLAANTGMRQEAHLRQDWWSKGEWTDTFIFAMLASDRP
jgi:RimJ/RimL family protein N-acetyltransferase